MQRGILTPHVRRLFHRTAAPPALWVCIPLHEINDLIRQLKGGQKGQQSKVYLKFKSL